MNHNRRSLVQSPPSRLPPSHHSRVHPNRERVHSLTMARLAVGLNEGEPPASLHKYVDQLGHGGVQLQLPVEIHSDDAGQTI
jgi:hypothetical protein